MSNRLLARGLWLVPLLLVAGVAVALGDGGLRARDGDPWRLEPVSAIGVRYDTLLLGGYAAGSFTEAVHDIAGSLSEAERTMVGEHLDKVFDGVLSEDGLGRSGRVRAAFERALAPDGSTRSVRVLAAEAAVGGRLHTAFYFERDGEQGFYDSFGRSVDPGSWTGPLLQARVSSPFGMRRMHPILKRVLPHAGVDYAAPAGTAVRATGDGVIAHAGTRGGYGLLVEIQHPSGYATRYAHLSRVSPDIRAKQHVRQGTVIGYVGSTGLATGPHLHYEVRAHGRAVDPERIAAASGLSRQLEHGVGWQDEHRRLTSLLTRAPTMLQGNRITSR